jgi:integrase
MQSFSGALRSAGVNEGSGGSQQSRASRVPSAVLRTSYLWYGGVWGNRKSGMVMNVMGHTDVRTAMRYQHPALDYVREAIDSEIYVTNHVTMN